MLTRKSPLTLITVVKLAIPLILGNLAIPLLGVIDTAVVGHLQESYDLSAIGLGTTVFDFLFWAFSFLRFSTTGLVAQAKGEENQQAIHTVLTQAIILALCLGLLLVTLQKPLITLVFHLLHSNNRLIIEHTYAFFHVGIWVAPIELLTYVVLGFLIGIQETRKVLYLVLITIIVAVPLDIAFVNGLKLGAVGIAYAYIIASAISLSVGLVWLYQLAKLYQYRWQPSLLFKLNTLKRIVVLNVNIFIRTICLLWVFTFFTTQGAQFGSAILGANVVLMNFQSMMAYAADGFTNVAESLVGETIGEHNKAHFYRVLFYTGICTLLVGIIFFFLYFSLGHYFIELLTNLVDVRKQANIYLKWVALLALASIWSFWLDGIFMGATKGATLRNAMLIALVLFMLVWWSTQAWQNTGLWFSLLMFMLFRAITLGSPLILWIRRLA